MRHLTAFALLAIGRCAPSLMGQPSEWSVKLLDNGDTKARTVFLSVSDSTLKVGVDSRDQAKGQLVIDGVFEIEGVYKIDASAIAVVYSQKTGTPCLANEFLQILFLDHSGIVTSLKVRLFDGCADVTTGGSVNGGNSSQLYFAGKGSDGEILLLDHQKHRVRLKFDSSKLLYYTNLHKGSYQVQVDRQSWVYDGHEWKLR